MFKLINDFIAFRSAKYRGNDADVPAPVLKRPITLIESFPKVSFTITSAQGGLILTAQHQTYESGQYTSSKASSRPREKIYIIHDTEDMHENIARIVQMELLSQ